MNKRITGVLFCLMSTILLSSYYVSAAIYMSGMTTKSTDWFHTGLEYVGYTLPIAAGICIFIGIVYLVLGTIDDHKQ